MKYWFSLKTFCDCYFAIHWINSNNNTCCWLEYKDAQGCCCWQFFSVCKQWHIFEFDDKCIMTLNSFYFINTHIKWSVCQSWLCKKIKVLKGMIWSHLQIRIQLALGGLIRIGKKANFGAHCTYLDRQSWTFKPK